VGVLAAAVMLGVVVTIAPAKPGVVVTKDGRKFEGEITEKNDQVIVNIRGVDMTLAREDITSIIYPEAFNKEFEDRLAKLDKNDVAGRIALARWAFDRRQYGKAREALDSAIALDPNNREAADLQQVITSQMRLESNKAPADARTLPTPPPNPTGAERRFLSAADINLMRQKELQSTDKVNVRFENNVEKRFMKYRNLQFNDFNALKPVDKALKILDEGDETMKADVKILGDPASIFEYRTTIQPIVLNGCATSNCHGGPKGADFILYNPADNDQAVYTNLYILLRYKMKTNEPASGVFGSSQRKMVDRGQGARSILVQYGLPVDVAELDHPIVAGYDGVFRTMQDLRMKQVADWMDHSLKQPDPDYGDIKFAPPKAASSQPTTGRAK
jgi:tetratricopeptide (TPR) repeat protein